MRQLLLSVFTILISFCAYAQRYPYINGDTLFISGEIRITRDQEVILGVGTLPDGDFRHISLARNSWLSAMSEGSSASDNYVAAKWSGHKFKVKDFRRYGTKKKGFTYSLILGGGNIVNYEADVANAINSGEIVLKENNENIRHVAR